MAPTLPALVVLGARALIGAAVRLARRRRSRTLAAPPVPVSSRPVRPASVSVPVSVPVVEPFSDAEQLPPPPARPGWAVLDAGQPLRVLADAVPLPCCALVALWAREVAAAEPRPRTPDSMTPAEIDRWARRYGFEPSAARAAMYATVTAAHEADTGWWKDANVWDSARIWSAPAAVQAMLGGEIVGPLVVGTDGPAPPLTPGRWHVVQHWYTTKSGKRRGHTYLLYADYESDGYDACTRVHSSIDRGYRVEPYTWGAGMDGYSVAVLTLPEVV